MDVKLLCRDKGKENVKVSGFCPYCGKDAFMSFLEINHVAGEKALVIEDNQRDHWWIRVCNACGRPLLWNRSNNATYPSILPSPTDERIPSPIRDAQIEAKKCFSVGAYQATAVMARLAIQRACRNHGATSGTLSGQVNELFEKNIITAKMKNWASAVRQIGNDGAHEQDDTVSPKDAEDVLKLSEQLLAVLYVTQALADEKIAERNNAQRQQ
jgi:hypothetical protein